MSLLDPPSSRMFSYTFICSSSTEECSFVKYLMVLKCSAERLSWRCRLWFALQASSAGDLWCAKETRRWFAYAQLMAFPFITFFLKAECTEINLHILKDDDVMWGSEQILSLNDRTSSESCFHLAYSCPQINTIKVQSAGGLLSIPQTWMQESGGCQATIGDGSTTSCIMCSTVDCT